MKNSLRIALAQINCTVGDLEGNTQKIIQYIHRSAGFGVDIIAFSELAITGYPPEDLLLKKSFIKDNLKTLQAVIEHTQGITVIVGFVDVVPAVNVGVAGSVNVIVTALEPLHPNNVTTKLS